MIRLFRFFFFILFSLYVAVFAATNRDYITIELIPGLYTMTLPVVILAFASAIFGFLLAAGYYSSAKSAYKSKLKANEKQLKQLQNDIKSLKKSQSTSLALK
jgi:uncharacterized integral membrane protein